jgi:hypothetical protein
MAGKALGGVKLTELHLLPRSRTVELYLHSNILLHGIMYNELTAGTISQIGSLIEPVTSITKPSA